MSARLIQRTGLPALAVALLPLCAAAEQVAIPILVDYPIIAASIQDKIFGGAERLHVSAPEAPCSRLELSRPRLRGGDRGSVLLSFDLEAVGGAQFGTGCITPFTWRGEATLVQMAEIKPGGDQLSFRLIDSRLHDPATDASRIPLLVWPLVKRMVHPRFAAFSYDLGPLLSSIGALLDATLPPAPQATLTARETLTVRDPRGTDNAVNVLLTFDVPGADAVADVASPPLDEKTMATWDTHWQSWDAFATWAIATLADDDATLRKEFMRLLLIARYQLRDALTREDHDVDPVRVLFRELWHELGPLTRKLALGREADATLRYLSFISAGDAIAALDQLARPLGQRFDRDTLREMARALHPDVDDDALQYRTEIDTALRELLGLSPALATAETAVRRDWRTLWSPLRMAHAAEEKLSTQRKWVPTNATLDGYLARVATLLDEVISERIDAGDIETSVAPIYRHLVEATAWQESCWRHFVDVDGAVKTLRSQAGSVGLMQVNVHVWRGIYDTDALAQDIAYNARAGNEILAHYLLDYALDTDDRGAQTVPDELARATYAAYNGGPRHLRRYRDPTIGASLRRIDDAFWSKYLAIREQGSRAVRACYGGN